MKPFVRKRIVLLTDCLADLAGGAEKQIYELAKGMDKNRYEVHVVSLDCWGQAPREIIEATGSQLHIFRVVRVYGLSGLLQGFRFYKFLKDNRIDILMTYHFSSDMWGTFWGHLAGVKTIISNRRDMGFWRNGLHITAYKLMNHWVNKIITVSESIKQMVIKEEGVEAERIEVIYNGVELDSRFRGNDNKGIGNDSGRSGNDNKGIGNDNKGIGNDNKGIGNDNKGIGNDNKGIGNDKGRNNQDSQELRSQLGLRSSDIVIMHVANLKPVKGHKYLLEAFAELDSRFRGNDIEGIGNDKVCGNDKKRNSYGIKLVLIGRDELNGQLQNMARELNILDKVLFLGKRDDVKSLLNLADICVLPSLSEGMSNAILEYMAAEKPVVATKVGGNPESVRNEFNGLLVEKENVEQLKEALLKLLQDKEKRQIMGHNGLLRVKTEFSMESMIEHYDGLFKKIASSPSAPRNDTILGNAPRNDTLRSYAHDNDAIGPFDTIKVLHLISSGGLFGAERVVLNLAGKSERIISFVGAINNSHNPHLEIIEEAKNLGLNTVIFDSRGKFDLGTIGAIKRFIIENKIDIVHTHNYKSDFIGFIATKLAGAKWIATHHGWIGTDKKLKLYEKMDSFILKRAQKIVSVYSKMKQNFLQKNIKEELLEVIDNGIPIEKFDRQIRNEQIRSLLGIRPGDCAIVIVGRLSKEKGHEIFLKAAAEMIKLDSRFRGNDITRTGNDITRTGNDITRTGNDITRTGNDSGASGNDKENSYGIKFIIVGDGPLREELKQQTHDLNLSEYVVFTGIREDMPAVYAACDMMVNASYAEGLPMTILEAMASHLPVIATDVGAVGEAIKDQENGILLQPGDAHQLALKMIELGQDKEKRQRLAQKAYQDVCDRFSDTRMAERYQEIYHSILH